MLERTSYLFRTVRRNVKRLASEQFASHRRLVASAADSSIHPRTAESHFFGSAAVAVDQGVEQKRFGTSIDELLKDASERSLDLNDGFWGKYTDIPSMAKASRKEEIMMIVDNFALIQRRHIYLFQRLKTTVIQNLDHWTASDLSALSASWAQLGFLHEDLCVAMAPRVAATASSCTAQELCLLMDAYATVRCSVQSVSKEMVRQTILKLEDFSPSQLCLHASSFARLDIRDKGLFELIAARLLKARLKDPSQIPAYSLDFASTELQEYSAAQDAGVEPHLTARDLALASYSFAKLGFFMPEVFDFLARGSLTVIRNFTARDLQTLTVAFVQAQHRDSELLEAISVQAQRRVAQFSSESLALMLRSMAFLGRRDDRLFTRTVVQLPRAILTFRPADITALIGAFAAAQVHSPALFDIVTPCILEKATMFTPADWLCALEAYASLGHKDLTFLSALGLHLDASKLSLPQLAAALSHCSRLSFSGVSASLSGAVSARLALEGPAANVEVTTQIYSALLLLGGASAGSEVSSLLKELGQFLSSHSSAISDISPHACLDRCHAETLASPIREEHQRILGPQGIFFAEDIREGLGGLQRALSAAGVHHELSDRVDYEAHLSIPRQGQRDLALLWGSRVHYISGIPIGIASEDALIGQASLSPAALLRIATLESLGKEVAVVPFWQFTSEEGRGQALLRFLSDKGHKI